MAVLLASLQRASKCKVGKIEMDIALLFNTGLSYTDIALDGPDLLTNKDLQTAVIISLFSDAPAQAGDQVDGAYTGGWWGDSFNTGVAGFKLGSRLWLLKRQKTTQAVANLAKQYCYEALQWLVDENVASSILVDTSISPLFGLNINVSIYKPNITVPEAYQWQDVWSQF
jgi:phage gp46-like protein